MTDTHAAFSMPHCRMQECAADEAVRRLMSSVQLAAGRHAVLHAHPSVPTEIPAAGTSADGGNGRSGGGSVSGGMRGGEHSGGRVVAARSHAQASASSAHASAALPEERSVTNRISTASSAMPLYSHAPCSAVERDIAPNRRDHITAKGRVAPCRKGA
jgi:hypothetical protein